MVQGWQKIIVWVMLEIALTWLGIDDLADCGEFVFEQHHLLNSSYPHQIVVIIAGHNSNC